MIDKSVIKICEKIKNNGGNCYFVGGFVRDYLLGIQSSDLDIEVFNITSEKLREILQTFHFIEHKKFGVFTKDNLTFALPRIEKKDGNKHYSFKVEILPNLTISGAAKRRDFTLNAIYMDVFTKDIIDPYNGINDLKNKTLKHITNKFIEDDVRIMRAIRFSSMYNLIIDKTTFDILKQMDINNVSDKRIENEISKMQDAKYKQNGINLAKELNIYEKIRI